MKQHIVLLVATVLALAHGATDPTNAPYTDYCCTFNYNTNAGTTTGLPCEWDNEAPVVWQWSAFYTPNTSPIPTFTDWDQQYMFLQGFAVTNASLKSPPIQVYQGDSISLRVYRYITEFDGRDRPLVTVFDNDHQGEIDLLIFEFEGNWTESVGICDTQHGHFCCELYPCWATFRITGYVLESHELLAFDDFSINGECDRILSSSTAAPTTTTPTPPPTTTTPAPTTTVTPPCICNFEYGYQCEWIVIEGTGYGTGWTLSYEYVPTTYPPNFTVGLHSNYLWTQDTHPYAHTASTSLTFHSSVAYFSIHYYADTYGLTGTRMDFVFRPAAGYGYASILGTLPDTSAVGWQDATLQCPVVNGVPACCTADASGLCVGSIEIDATTVNGANSFFAIDDLSINGQFCNPL